MLLNHIERVQQKSENYKQIYTLSVSVLFTALVASVWAVAGLSPAGIVKTETGNIVGSFVDSLKSFTGKTFLGDSYKVEFKDGSLGIASNEDTIKGGAGLNDLNSTISTTTSSGITIEAEIVKEDNLTTESGVTPIVPSGQ